MAVRVLLVVAALVVLYGCGQEQQGKQQGKQDQAQPVEPKPKPTLEDATLYVAGSNGGPYKVSWTVWTPNLKVLHKFRGTGVIKDAATAYPINLEGFVSNRNEVFFPAYDEIEMEVTKTEPWKGVLVMVLKVNDTPVECETMKKTYPRHNYSWEESIGFDADKREDYKQQAGCANRLES